jgi:hypothetical protein
MKPSNQSTAISATYHPATDGSPDITRRKFLASAGAAAVGLTILKPELVGGAEANSKLDLGVIGCGGRGAWIAELFAKNGHYNLVALADYFQDRVDATGEKLNVPPAKRFTALSGYKQLLAEKLDAVAIESPPYFHPEQAAAAVEAGKHVYVAKPLAVDVPGCQSIAASGRQATETPRKLASEAPPCLPTCERPSACRASASTTATASRRSSTAGPGSGGLVFWPFMTPFSPAGLPSGIRGRLSGLQLSHHTPQIIRAVAEGLACVHEAPSAEKDS